MTSKTLQTSDTDLEQAAGLLNSSLNAINNLRGKFYELKEKAATIAKSRNITTEFENKRHRRVKNFFDELSTDERSTNAEKLFEVEVFKASIDTLSVQLKNRFDSMKKASDNFNFLTPKNCLSLSDDALYRNATKLQSVYHRDLSTEFPEQILSLKKVFADDLRKLPSIRALGEFLIIKNRCTASNLPHVCNAILLFLTLPVTVAAAERSFSKLKLIKSYLRSTMSEQRLSDLAVISIEHVETKKLNLEELINNFAVKNVRRASRFL